MNEKGNLSINSENFLPIIKKWLYTDKDIFVRELVSNACDAVTKLQKLVQLGEADIPADESYEIHVILNLDHNTLEITDNGIGMTADEIKKYINQIAFSGASDFMAKFQEKEAQGNEIIGHFGLGFYSAFMVADRVEIDTLSYQKDAAAAKWICDGGIDYEMTGSTKQERGTTITLHIGEDGKEFLSEATLYTALKKYCSFMPVPVFIDVVKAPTAEEAAAAAKEANTLHVSPEEAEGLTAEDALEKLNEKKAEDNAPTPLNDTHPLWLKQPGECTDEEYKEFYHQVFFDRNDPLFWIHLNMDYPFRLKGILYFPKLVEHMDIMEGEVKLYANQVYIADNIKEVVPEFLLLLKGVLDCPDMPLNVSRSALQNDGYVDKMRKYITKKVADKLVQLFKNDRSVYESFWNDIGIFIKYGCMREEKFYDKVKDVLLFETINQTYVTLAEYLEKNKEKHENKLFFVSDENQQAQYVRLFREQELEAVILSTTVDKPFVSFLEYKNPGLKLQRIDADISDTLQQKPDEDTSEAKKQADAAANEAMQALFRELLQHESLTVTVENLKAKNISAMILLSEESRRMMEMMEAYGDNADLQTMFAQVKPNETLVLNRTNALVQALLTMREHEDKKEEVAMLCQQIYDLALMSHRQLTAQEMTKFIDRSNILLEKLAAYEA